MAIAAAAATAYVIWRAAHIPVRRQEAAEDHLADRRRLYVASVLRTELMRIANRAKHAASTIKVFAAGNYMVNEDTKAKMQLELHPILGDWESMSLLPPAVLEHVLNLQRELDDHNFDVLRAGGAFGAENFKQSMTSRLDKISSIAQAIAGETELVARKAGGKVKAGVSRSGPYP